MIRNDHNPLQKFLNGKDANNRVNCWSMELVTYHITFEWISGACNKAADCLSRLVEVLGNDATASNILVSAVIASSTDGSTTHSCSKTNTPVVMLLLVNTKINASQPLMRECRDSLLQMQWMAPFCKCISSQLNNSKAPHHESDTFPIDGVLYKYALDASQKCLALVIPHSRHFTVFVEVHDKFSHQGVMRTYHVI